jgi:hypothetical protein
MAKIFLLFYLTKKDSKMHIVCDAFLIFQVLNEVLGMITSNATTFNGIGLYTIVKKYGYWIK